MKWMLRYFLVILIVAILILPCYANDNTLDLHAHSAVLIDADSGRILYGKDENAQRSVASTTKIMTCLLAVEYADLNKICQVSSHVLDIPEVKMGLKDGEKYKLSDLCYAMMLESHNDAAVVIAENLAGSVSKFADIMNLKAKELGCQKTFFITPNGLDASEGGYTHCSTAYDLALILREAVKNKKFIEIAQKRQHTFSELSGSRQFTVYNKNKLFDLLEGTIAGKTGYTGQAGYCYAGAVSKNGKTWIAVVLGSGWPPNKNYKWEDMKKLIHYGEDNYHLEKTKISPPDMIYMYNKRKWYREVFRTDKKEIDIMKKKEESIKISYLYVNRELIELNDRKAAGKYFIKVDNQILYEGDIYSLSYEQMRH